MSFYVSRKLELIPPEVIKTIFSRFQTIVKSVNKEFWNESSDLSTGIIVGSYGRGTAIKGSDIDLLIVLPRDEYYRFNDYKNNGQSHLLQAVKNPITNTYSQTEVHADGQVIQVVFSDKMKFEIVPVFLNHDAYGIPFYIYPDSNFGGKWLPTYPQVEQMAMKKLNVSSKGLLFDTCKHIRNIRDSYFENYHLSGIVIDSFVYRNIGDWHWPDDSNLSTNKHGDYENYLYNCYLNGYKKQKDILTPGSNTRIDFARSSDCLERVLLKMNE